ncbi:conjugal transfer protein [Rhizobium leguminosarum]|uniref:MobQ family relaxase n=1 Tax=Rhizobium leguminosarum TaxID=384 RepID=UPI0010304646|nr:MobQ family relaxase [Rhizobium leguminosarum]TBD04565.1 conjugal transfer protein [Rhizobium leguminosarum]
MAIYHLHVKNISRGDGRSIVAAAAYRAGETLPNEAEERLSAFGGRRDVVLSEIHLPPGAPAWMAHRATLWNAVEAAEKRKDARLAKEIEFALPVELPKAAWQPVARAMADAYTSQGFVADVAVHDDGTQHNPHVHLLLTTRVVTADGFGPKIRSADGVQFVTEARSLWARVANEALAKAGIAVAIDSRSHAERNLEQTPGQHRGPDRAERRARRERLQQERELMKSTDGERDLPVPDPDGNPIHPHELAQAETRLLDDMHAAAPAGRDLSGDTEDARAAIEAQNAREMSEDEAAAYRLAPEDMLDWLGEPARPLDPADEVVLEHWENHLDWLEIDRQQPAAPSDEELQHEPERDRR